MYSKRTCLEIVQQTLEWATLTRVSLRFPLVRAPALGARGPTLKPELFFFLGRCQQRHRAVRRNRPLILGHETAGRIVLNSRRIIGAIGHCDNGSECVFGCCDSSNHLSLVNGVSWRLQLPPSA